MAESCISPYNLSELKNTTDDTLGNYLRSLGFQQDNSKLDVRLALGYAAVIVAGATFAADYKLGWEATKYWTAVAVAVYAVLNGGLTYWMWAVEKGLVFQGTRSGSKVRWAICNLRREGNEHGLTQKARSPSSPAPGSTTQPTTSKSTRRLHLTPTTSPRERLKFHSRRGSRKMASSSRSLSSSGWRVASRWWEMRT